MQSHASCICLIFLHCVFSNASSNCLHQRMQSHTGCICLIFSPLCVFKCVLKLLASEDAKSHWLHLFDFSPLCVFKWFLKLSTRWDAKSHCLHFWTFLHCVLSNGAWMHLDQTMHNCTDCICLIGNLKKLAHHIGAMSCNCLQCKCTLCRTQPHKLLTWRTTC